MKKGARPSKAALFSKLLQLNYRLHEMIQTKLKLKVVLYDLETSIFQWIQAIAFM